MEDVNRPARQKQYFGYIFSGKTAGPASYRAFRGSAGNRNGKAADLTPVQPRYSVLSLSNLPPHFHRAAENVLLVPLGALVVVLFRSTLGLKVLGLFRPPMAFAFDAIGIPLSLGFLFFVLVIVVGLRSLLTTDHSYCVAVFVSLTASMLFAPLIVGNWWHDWLRVRIFDNVDRLASASVHRPPNPVEGLRVAEQTSKSV
jgi:7 transmembrane helices usually fused to an inactive transglutaminase